MDYRKLPKGEEQLSILGLGTGSIGMAAPKEAEATIALAIESGINLIDMASGDAAAFPACKRALGGLRDQVYYQIHFGADFSSGKYGWTTDLDAIKRSIDWQLGALGTDYIDFGFVHCIDEDADLATVMDGGTLDYIQSLKARGVVRRIGLSSHAPHIVDKMLDTGLIDLVMFSINPGYDYRQGSYAIGDVDERLHLYNRCAAQGVGITVMKPFSGGQLLSAQTSPFARALTKAQCIQYALDKPGVLSVLPGVRGLDDLKRNLSFLSATAEERDYSILGSFAPPDAQGNCVYCNHCQPCPQGLDIGLINKYYDLTLAGDALAKSHYLTLEKTAGGCIGCGHCVSRCPFDVKQMQRMDDIAAYFGK